MCEHWAESPCTIHGLRPLSWKAAESGTGTLQSDSAASLALTWVFEEMGVGWG